MYTHQKQVITQGPPLAESQKALILIHGRGATAESILSLASPLGAGNFTLFAPQATNNSWYPYSFMAPAANNQPALNSALEIINEIVQSILDQGLSSKQIYLAGFSQGACLTAEYATRHAQPYGGLFIFTGGLIGQHLSTGNYQGDFAGTPVFISTGDPDLHVPVSRVNETLKIMEEHGALVTQKIYKGRPHTILQEEINLARQIITKAYVSK